MEYFYIFEDQLAVEGSVDIVSGIRIMIEGNFKQVIHQLLEQNAEYSSCSEIIGLAVKIGITEIIKEIKKNSLSD